MNEINDLTLSFTLDDGRVIDCSVLITFMVNDKNIIAVLPIVDVEEQEILLFEYRDADNKDSDDKISFFTIDNDDLFDAALHQFNILMTGDNNG